jgi:hypothetical protein
MFPVKQPSASNHPGVGVMAGGKRTYVETSYRQQIVASK